MLGVLKRKLHLLCSRLQWLLKKPRRPKLIIKRLLKMTRRRGSKEDTVKKSLVHDGPIRVATFNVAMFALAPAIRKEEYTIPSTSGSYPKGILKQSPLHANVENHPSKPNKKLKVSINLPENEISLAHCKFLSMEDGEKENMTSVLMRSPVWWTEESLRGSKNRRSIYEVLREVDADVLGLQDVKADEERGMSPLSDLAAALRMNYVFAESWAPQYGNAVLSKWPIKKWIAQKIADENDFRNVLKVMIDAPGIGEVNFYCTQLDHLDENWRLKQMSAIIQENNSPHVLLGGLNSLSESDYTTQRWTDILKYYENIGKPTPRVEMMRFLKGRGYEDSKNFAGECEPVIIIAKGQNVQGTCKYGTRVDYILASPDSPYKLVPGSYSVVSSKGTSDHHIVKVDIMKTRDYKQKHERRLNKGVVSSTNPLSSRYGLW